MLACYYDLRQAGQFENLFGDTYIGQHPTEEHNQYLVLRFDFSKMVMADSVGELEIRFNQLNCTPINSLVRREAYYAHLFGGLNFRDEDSASTMLEDTLAFVKDHNLPPLYIIIDEYDNFTNQLETDFIDMLGFTYPETATYLKYIIEKYAEEEVSRAVSGAVSGTSVR